MKNTKIQLALTFIGFFILGIVIAYLLIDITKKQVESDFRHYQIHPVGELEDDPKKWGLNHPLQYESYLKTQQQTPTAYGGSMAIDHDEEGDLRDYVSRSKLEMDPRLKVIWAGYSFAHDSREKRGHAYMLVDQVHTKRQEVASQPGACLNCHASTVVPMLELGDGDLEVGFEKLNKMSYHEGLEHVSGPIACIDCHTPTTMELRVTRPAFKKGIQKLKAQEGVHNYDVNRDASHQEMRSFVCAQCHVNYHFEPESKELTFPWSEGIKADEILKYYEKNPHTDWVHAKTGAKMIKGQHPEFEMWSQGPHARAGVSCVDCHMPYERSGAQKYTNHHIQSPLLNAEKSCTTCHGATGDEMVERAQEIQDSHHEMLDTAMQALVELIHQIEDKKDQLGPKKLTEVQKMHSQAQFLIDFVEAENSTGFHAPQESGRVLLKALNIIRKASAQVASGSSD